MNRRRAATVLTTAAATLAAGLIAAGPAQAGEVRPVPADGSFTFSGHGYGHGIGMSQWGAQSRAVAGQSYRQILDFYYPGTTVASRENRTLRVQLTGSSGRSVTVAAPTGAELTISTSGRKLPAGQRLVVDAAGGQLAARVDGAWGETWGATTISGPDGVLLVRPDGSATRYDGTVRIVPGETLTVVNDVPMETYLRGVVPAESPASWNAEALKAQAVAARSYALSVLRPTAQTDICDTTACQVYRGAETRDSSGKVTWTQPASTNAAIAATAGEVRAYGGDVAFTQFSSSNGGWSVAGSRPYLQAREDPFSAPGRTAPGDTVANWTTSVPASRFAPSCPAGGAVTALDVTGRDGRGADGGRVATVVLHCTTGTTSLTGNQVRQLGGLRSNWFTIPSAIRAAHADLGGDGGPLGPAATGEYPTPGRVGAYQHFRHGSIYVSPRTGAHDVRGELRRRWEALGWENGVLGFPTTGEARTPDGRGTYNHFEGGSIYWSNATGAQDVRGAIRGRWAQLGWENSPLGFPTTGEPRTPNGRGAYNHF
ncbi:SpoIID/LytB domain-containing protein [Kineococcus sp. G2]|uniref:SpoIID/LytB domain-containing protein n=1 Tax=Kineococcus sp. G2 TaxID=3127484 RepID=UPI00301C01F7